MSGSKKPAIDGQLIILCAGDEALFKEAEPAFSKMGKRWMYLGQTGAGARMKLVVNMIMVGLAACHDRCPDDSFEGVNGWITLPPRDD